MREQAVVSDFLRVKGKIFLSSVIFKTASVHLFFQFVLLGIRMETWKTIIQHPFTRMSLVPEPWSQFQFMLGYDLRSPSVFRALLKKGSLRLAICLWLSQCLYLSGFCLQKNDTMGLNFTCLFLVQWYVISQSVADCH